MLTASNSTAVGCASGTAAGITYNNVSLFGYQAEATGANQVQLGNASTTTYAYGAVQNRSDARDKADVRDTVLGLDFINALRPVDFKWDRREQYVDVVAEEVVTVNEDGKEVKTVKYTQVEVPKDGSRKRERYHHGVIAQEVQAVIEQTGVDFGGFQDHSLSGGKDVMSIGYEEFIAPLIKAVQELTAQNKELVDRITALEAK